MRTKRVVKDESQVKNDMERSVSGGKGVKVF